MKKGIVSLTSIMVILTLILSLSAFAEGNGEEVSYKPLFSLNFDNIGLGTVTSYSESGFTVTIDGKTSAPVTGETSPAGKSDGSSMSSGDSDRAIALNVGNANDNPNIRFGFSNSDFKGKLKLSFQFYVPNCQNASYGLLSAYFRDNVDSNSYSNLLSLRGNTTIQYFPSVNSPADNGKFSKSKWYKVEYYINADTLTYDVYLDGVKKGEGYPIKSGVSFAQFRLATINSSVTVKDTKILIDDLFFGVETDRPTPVFLKTTHSSGTDYTETVNVPKDMTGIAAQFMYDMDETSFDGNVSLTRGKNKIPVPFTGVWNSASKTYTAVLNEKAAPCTEYLLTFGNKVKTSQNQPDSIHAGVELGTPETISVTTEMVDFAALDGYFTSDAAALERLVSIPNGAGKIYANLDLVSSELLESPKDVSVFVLCYQNGLMQKLWMNKASVQPAESGINEQRIQVEVDPSNIIIDENTRLEIVVWDDYLNTLPLMRMEQLTK